jgi:hypothetical protein
MVLVLGTSSGKSLYGKPLDWQTASAEKREKVMEQLVDIFNEIEEHPLDAMGSLASVGDTFKVDGLAQ